MTICPFCNAENDSNAIFCYNCGKKLPETDYSEQQKIRICPVCHTSNNPSAKYCINCGTLLIKKPLPTKRRLADYWYCSEHSVKMHEVDPNNQLMISRNILEDVNKLLLQNRITESEKEMIIELAQQVFDENPRMHYAILTKIRCPTCRNELYVPVNERPPEQYIPSYFRQTSYYNYYEEKRVSVKNLLKKGWYYSTIDLKQLLPVFISVAFVLLFKAVFPEVSTNLHLIIVTYGSQIELSRIIDKSIRDFIPWLIYLLVTTFTSCWIVLIFKQMKVNNNNDVNINDSIKKTTEVFPKTFLANLSIASSIFLASFIIMAFYLIIALILTFIINLSLPLLGGAIIMLIVLITFAIFSPIVTTYLIPVMVITDLSFKEGIKRTLDITIKYFWTTLGFFIVMFLVTSVMNTLIIEQSYPFTLLSTGITELTRCFALIALSWAYDEHKDEFKQKVSSNNFANNPIYRRRIFPR